ncbi:MAG: hypothetical protein AB9869_02860 [Verrucomicrobiia bacterium]
MTDGPEFGNALAMTGDKKALTALHFGQQFRKPRLGFQRADFLAFHGHQCSQSGQICQSSLSVSLA